LDNLGGDSKQLARNLEAERLGGIEVDHQIVFDPIHTSKGKGGARTGVKSLNSIGD